MEKLKSILSIKKYINKEGAKMPQLYKSSLDYVKIKDFKDLFSHAYEEYGDGPAFKIKTKNDKTVKEYRTIMISQFLKDYKALGTAIYEKGLKNVKVALVSENRYEWCVAYAAVTCGLRNCCTIG